MPKKLPYKHSPLLPGVIAETVCQTPYTGSEWSEKVRDYNQVERIEALRQQMTKEQIEEFARLTEDKCEAAYEANAQWMVKIVMDKTNNGRDQLYVWVTHWMASYLDNPNVLRRKNNLSPSTLSQTAI